MGGDVVADHGGVDGAGADCVDADVLPGVVDGEGTREFDDGAFGDAVGEAAFDRDEPGDRGEVDDVAVALAPHDFNGGLGAEEDAAGVDGLDAVVVVDAGFVDAADVHDAEAVDEDVEAGEAGEQVGDRVRRGHVEREVGRGMEIGDGDDGSLVAEGLGDGRADAGGSAGH